MEHPTMRERPNLSKPSMQTMQMGSPRASGGWGSQVLMILFTIFIIAIVFGIMLIASITTQSTLINVGSTPVPGGGGGYGLYIQTGNYYNLGVIIANGMTATVGGGNGGGGVVIVSYNSVNGHYVGANILFGGGQGPGTLGGSGSNAVNTFAVSGNAIPFALTSVTACTANNVASLPAAGCAGSVYYTQSVTLTSGINVTNDIIVQSGAILTTNGWPLIGQNSVMVLTGGKVMTGYVANGGAAGLGSAPGVAGTGAATSYGGAGAGGTGCIAVGAAGGATQVAAGTGGAATTGGLICTSGNTGTAATAMPVGIFTNANILLYAQAPANVVAYLSGGGGGGSGANTIGNPVGTTGQTPLSVFINLISYLVTLSNFVGIIILLAIIVVVIGVLYYFFGNRGTSAFGGGL